MPGRAVFANSSFENTTLIKAFSYQWNILAYSSSWEGDNILLWKKLHVYDRNRLRFKTLFKHILLMAVQIVERLKVCNSLGDQ